MHVSGPACWGQVSLDEIRSGNIFSQTGEGNMAPSLPIQAFCPWAALASLRNLATLSPNSEGPQHLFFNWLRNIKDTVSFF